MLYFKNNNKVIGNIMNKDIFNNITSSEQSSEISEFINSLVPGDDMWKMRASSFMTSLIKVLVALRDDNKLILDVATIRSFLELRMCEDLIKRTDIDEVHKRGLKSYLINIPGYNSDATDQESVVFQHHGYVSMQFTEILAMIESQIN